MAKHITLANVIYIENLQLINKINFCNFRKK